MADYDWAIARLLRSLTALHRWARRYRRRHRDCPQKALTQWSLIRSRGTAVLFRRRQRSGIGGCMCGVLVWYGGWRGGRLRTRGHSCCSRDDPAIDISERLRHVIPSMMRRIATVEEIKSAQRRTVENAPIEKTTESSREQLRQVFCNQLCNKQTSDRPAYAYILQ